MITVSSQRLPVIVQLRIISFSVLNFYYIVIILLAVNNKSNVHRRNNVILLLLLSFLDR